MNTAPIPPHPQVTIIRRLSTAYYLLAAPMALLSAIIVLISFVFWMRGHEGTDRGFEFADATGPYSLAAVAVFVLLYLFTYFGSHRLIIPSRAWVPSAIQIPALAWLLIASFISSHAPFTPSGKLWDLTWQLYLALLLTLLGTATFIALQSKRAQTLASPKTIETAE